MRRRWLFICLFLLAAQFLTLWRATSAIRTEPPVAPAFMCAELLDLASELESFHAALRKQVPVWEAAGAVGDVSTALRREEQLLQVADTESALQAQGKEVRISAEIQSWLSGTGREHMEDGRLATYLDGMRISLQRIAKGELAVVDRILLQPEGGEAFPGISFEAEGNPMALGQLLLSFPADQQYWELKEFELCRLPARSDWWIRGSVIFRPPGS